MRVVEVIYDKTEHERLSWDEYFMAVAKAAALRSTCPRLSVGAVIVNSQRSIIATGYNGSLPGHDHCTDVGCDMVDNSCKRTIHAEVNAIKQTSWSTRAGSKLYCTHIPCMNCATAITKSGISEVYYGEDYKNYSLKVGAFLNEHGIVLAVV